MQRPTSVQHGRIQALALLQERAWILVLHTPNMSYVSQ